MKNQAIIEFQLGFMDVRVLQKKRKGNEEVLVMNGWQTKRQLSFLLGSVHRSIGP